MEQSKLLFFPASFDQDTVAVIIPSVMRAGKDGASQFGGKNIKRVMLKNEQGLIVLQKVNDNDILFILADNAFKPADLLLRTQEFAERLASTTQ